MVDLPTAREAMSRAVAATEAGQWDAAFSWTIIATELREGSRPPTEDERRADADRRAYLDDYAAAHPDSGPARCSSCRGDWSDPPAPGCDNGMHVGSQWDPPATPAETQRIVVDAGLRVGGYVYGDQPLTDAEIGTSGLVGAINRRREAAGMPEAVDVTQQLHGDTFCRNCSRVLIWYTGRAGSAPDDVDELWLHRSNYQTLCPVPNNDSGECMFADPVSDQ